jgi:hypothetical protein
MMQNTPLENIPSSTVSLEPVSPDTDLQHRPATVWVSRITSVVGAICLGLALLLWATRHGHYRPVLALLTVAMFAAILHSYTFEDGS